MKITERVWTVEVGNFARCTFRTDSGIIEVEVDRLGYCNVTEISDRGLTPLTTFHVAILPIIREAMRRVGE